jgi:signal transduction histidine kinase
MIYFEKAYNLANRSRDLSMKVLCTCNLAQVNLNGGNYEKSAKLFEKCKELTNEKYDIDKIWESSQLEKKLMLKVKQKEISNLANENRLRNLQRNVFVILAIFLFFILLMGYYQYRLNQKRAQVIFQQKEALNELNATKDQLFSVIGHDLRSSVNALRNGTRALEQSFESIDLIEARNQLEQNSIIASNTYSLLDNLLQWSLLQTNGGYFIQDEHRLSLLIDQVVYDYRGQLSQNSIEFVNEVPRAIRVWVDAESVKLILRNLMDNSIKFSKESGKISTYVQDETDKAVTLVWEDEGEGMSQETRNKLLTAKRLDRKEHEHTIGAGLGMQLVFSMIYRNGGTLDILSEVGKGTKMLITLLKK